MLSYTYQRIIKMKPIDVNKSTYIDFDIMRKILDLMLVATLEYQNIYIFLQQNTILIGQRKVLVLKVKNIAPWVYEIEDLNTEETVGTFYKKELKRNKTRLKFHIEIILHYINIIQKEGDKLYVK